MASTCTVGIWDQLEQVGVPEQRRQATNRKQETEVTGYEVVHAKSSGHSSHGSLAKFRKSPNASAAAVTSPPVGKQDSPQATVLTQVVIDGKTAVEDKVYVDTSRTSPRNSDRGIASHMSIPEEEVVRQPDRISSSGQAARTSTTSQRAGTTGQRVSTTGQRVSSTGQRTSTTGQRVSSTGQRASSSGPREIPPEPQVGPEPESELDPEGSQGSEGSY